MVKKGELFNAYSSYFNILENVGQYSSQNTAKLILLSFIEQMKADGFYSTLSEADRKVIDTIVECIRKKLCIVPYTSACMKKKAEKVYIGEYEDCIFYNKEAASYVDLNPQWEEVSYLCRVNSQGYKTGIKVVTYGNTNPLYTGVQTKESVTVDNIQCANNAPNWQQYGSPYCEVSGGDNTGYLITEYRDVNPNSSTYNTIEKRKTLDADQCPLPTPVDTNPIWVEVSRACELNYYEYSENPSASHTTGYALKLQRDVNPNSATYNTEETVKVSDSNCPFESVRWLVYTDTELKTKTINRTSAAYSVNIPLSYFINDDLNLDWHGSVKEGNAGRPEDDSLPQCITANNNTRELEVSIPKNTTGKDRTLRFSVGADYDPQPLYLTVTQTADAVFTWDNSSVSKTLSNISANGFSESYSVISAAGGEFHDYNVYSASSGISATKSGSTVTVTVAKNTTTSQRTLVLKLRQQDSNKEITLTAIQNAAVAPQVSVFTATPTTLSFTSDGGTKTISIVSTIDNVATDYTFVNNFSNATVTKNGNTLTVVAASSTSAITGTIVLTQNASLNNITINVSQAAPSYVFTWEDGTTSRKSWLQAVGDGDSEQFTVISTKDGTSAPFTVESSNSWIEVSAQSGTITVSVSENKTRDPRTGTVTLTQTNSSKTLVLAISQNANPAIQNERYIAVGTMQLSDNSVQVSSYLTETSNEAYFGEEMNGDQNYPSMQPNFYIPSEGYFKFQSSDSSAYFEINGTPYSSGDIAYVPNEITSILIKH